MDQCGPSLADHFELLVTTFTCFCDEGHCKGMTSSATVVVVKEMPRDNRRSLR